MGPEYAMAEHDSKERIVPFTHETAKRRYLDYRNDIRVAAFAYGLKLDADGSRGLAQIYASVIDGERDPNDIVPLAGLSGDELQQAEKANADLRAAHTTKMKHPNNVVYKIIHQSLSGEAKKVIKDVPLGDGFRCIEVLDSKYASGRAASVTKVCLELLTERIEGTPLPAHLTKMRELRERYDAAMAACKNKEDALFMAAVILSFAGSQFEDLAKHLATMTEPTMDQLEHVVSDWDTIGAAHRNTARDEGDMLRRIDEQKRSTKRRDPRGGNPRRGEKNRRGKPGKGDTMRCHICDSPDHLRRDCPLIGANKYKTVRRALELAQEQLDEYHDSLGADEVSSEDDSDNESVFMALQVPLSEVLSCTEEENLQREKDLQPILRFLKGTQLAVVDSGATTHVVKDESLLNHVDKTKSCGIRDFSGNVTRSGGTGSTTWLVERTDKELSRLTLDTVVLLPSSDYNLLSASRLIDQGFEVVFSESPHVKLPTGKCVPMTRVGHTYFIIFMPDGADTSKSAKNDNSTHRLDDHEIVRAFTQPSDSMAHLWHARLHCGNQYLQLLPEVTEGVSLQGTADLQNIICDGCVSGKMKQLDLPKGNRPKPMG